MSAVATIEAQALDWPEAFVFAVLILCIFSFFIVVAWRSR